MKASSITLALAAALIVSGPLAFGQSRQTTDNYVYEDSSNRYGFRVTSEPNFPAILLQEGIDKGQATIVFEVSPEGELTQLVPIEATHEAFAREAERAMRRWEFAPPVIDGESVFLTQKVSFDFESTGNLFVRTSDEFALEFLAVSSRSGQPGAISLTPASKLDRPLDPISTPKPAWDAEWLDGKEEVEIVFTFYVDQNGQVKLPTVSQAPYDVDPRLVEESVLALQEWRFAPPRRNGQPTVARASQPLVFR